MQGRILRSEDFQRLGGKSDSDQDNQMKFGHTKNFHTPTHCSDFCYSFVDDSEGPMDDAIEADEEVAQES